MLANILGMVINISDGPAFRVLGLPPENANTAGMILRLAIIAIATAFKSGLKALRIAAGEILLIVSYALSNMPLVRQLLGKGYEFVSNKSETLIYSRSALDILKSYILGGDPYTACFQKIIICFAIVSVVLAFIFFK